MVSQGNGTIFRVDKTKDFTVMSNHHLRNVTLSLKAKGLLSLILSLPDNWDYSLNGLATICKDGVDSVKSGVRELENKGYIRRVQLRTKGGQLGRMSFYVSETPTFKNALDKEFLPSGETPPTANLPTETPPTGKPIQSNTKELNTKISNTNQSIIAPSVHDEDLTEQVKKQIDYELLITEHKAELINSILIVMLDVYKLDTTIEFFTRGKNQYNTMIMLEKVKDLDYRKLTEWINDELYSVTEKIKNLPLYLMQAIYRLAPTWHNDNAKKKKLTENTASYNLEELEKMLTHGSVWD